MTYKTLLKARLLSIATGDDCAGEYPNGDKGTYLAHNYENLRNKGIRVPAKSL